MRPVVAGPGGPAVRRLGVAGEAARCRPCPRCRGSRPRGGRVEPRGARVAAVAAAAVLAAGVAIGALVAGGGDDAPPEGPALALRGSATPARRRPARRAWSAGRGRPPRAGQRPEPSAPGAFYELWLLDGADRLLSLGAFRVPASGTAEVTVPLPVDVTDFRFIDVSAEPEDGDPGHSGDSVLRPTAPALIAP